MLYTPFLHESLQFEYIFLEQDWWFCTLDSSIQIPLQLSYSSSTLFRNYAVFSKC